MLFCEHESGDSHLVSQIEHEAEPHGEICHVEGTAIEDSHDPEWDCDPCIDTEVESNASLDEAPPHFDRSIVKVPPFVGCAALAFFVSIPEERLVVTLYLSRVPPVLFSAIIQYTDTVQFSC